MHYITTRIFFNGFHQGTIYTVQMTLTNCANEQLNNLKEQKNSSNEKKIGQMNKKQFKLA